MPDDNVSVNVLLIWPRFELDIARKRLYSSIRIYEVVYTQSVDDSPLLTRVLSVCSSTRRGTLHEIVLVQQDVSCPAKPGVCAGGDVPFDGIAVAQE